jgi:nicotinamide-nucleotide amidase
MFDEQVAPTLREVRTDRTIRRRRLRTVGIGETDIARKLQGIRLADITLSYLPGPWHVDLWLTSRAADEQQATTSLLRASEKIEDLLHEWIYGVDDDVLELVVAALLMMKGATLAVAESCTGGSLSSRLTDVSGSSAYFERGVVAYSDIAKRQILKVPKRILDRHGAVSQETAVAMAEGVRRISATQLGLSTTGIAGPTGATEEKPVGLVFVGLAHPGGSAAHRFLFGQDRAANKECGVRAALDVLRRHLLDS